MKVFKVSTSHRKRNTQASGQSVDIIVIGTESQKYSVVKIKILLFSAVRIAEAGSGGSSRRECNMVEIKNV